MFWEWVWAFTKPHCPAIYFDCVICAPPCSLACTIHTNVAGIYSLLLHSESTSILKRLLANMFRLPCYLAIRSQSLNTQLQVMYVDRHARTVNAKLLHIPACRMNTCAWQRTTYSQARPHTNVPLIGYLKPEARPCDIESKARLLLNIQVKY